MKIEVLSHACMLVTHKSTSVIIDPWLVGSAYWRSWWNYPKAAFDEERIKSVDAVVISHIHWDHWHGATLKKYFKDKQFFIPNEPGVRSELDLKTIGISNVTRLQNGKTLELKDLKLRLYQFGLHLNDSAIVIESDNHKLLNANDAKIAGASLQSLLKKEGRIDFAFRSHSTANARACYKIRGSTQSFDDNDHYMRSFKFFMDTVQPKYAVPFASNHCHLHTEVFKYNEIISSPDILRDFLENQVCKWTFKVMLPGSAWSQDTGFTHLHSEEVFVDRSAKLLSYQKEVESLLKKQDLKEEAVVVSEQLLERFVKLLPLPSKVPNKFKRPFLLRLTFPSKSPVIYRLNLLNERYVLQKLELPKSILGPELAMPALIFKDAILKNMFHHAAISKRCEFLGDNIEDLKLLSFWQGVLEKRELIGSAGITMPYFKRLVRAYSMRLPELAVYLKAFILSRIFGRPMYQVEELILRGKWFDKDLSRVSVSDR